MLSQSPREEPFMFTRYLVVLAVLFGGVLRSSAQTASGTILGLVRDAQDAAIPGAKITVTHTGSNISRMFTTGSSGSYTIPFLAPGTYDVSAEAPGFRRASRTGIRLS